MSSRQSKRKVRQSRIDLDDKYQQYSLRLDDLRGHDVTSPSQFGVESGESDMMMRGTGTQSVDLKEHLIKLITTNRLNPDIDDASFESVDASESEDDVLIDRPMAASGSLIKQDLLTTANKQPDGDVKTAIVSVQKLEEEGHYVPTDVRNKTTRLENRLLREDPEKSRFFDATGALRNDAPLLRRIPPPMRKKKTIQAPGETENVDESMFVPASIWGVENASTARHIRVEIREIRFLSHPLSSDQEVLAFKLQQLVESYLRDIDFSRTQYFMDRIQALRREMKKRPEDEKRILGEIVECHAMRDTEEERLVNKREAIVETWHVLRDLRTKGRTTTGITLKWHSRKYNEEEKAKESNEFEKTITKRAKEMCRLKELETGEKLDLEKVKNDLKAAHSDRGLRQPGETQWLPVLVETPIDEYDDLVLEEKDRFVKLAKARLYVSFMMGTTELRSDDVPVDRTFKAAPNIGCHAITMHIPTGVRVHIREYGYDKSRELGSVVLPVYNGDPPKFMDYEFTGTTMLEDGRMIQGIMTARCFIEPAPESLLTLISPGNNVKPRKPRPHARISVQKLLEIADEHDPNDPYMIAAIASIKEERGEHGISGSFKLDADAEATLFASIMPSEICKEIESRANDIVRPSAEKPVLFEEKEHQIHVDDVVTEPQIPSFKEWFLALCGCCRKQNKEDKLVFHRLQPNSSIVLHLERALYLPRRTGREGTFSGLRLCSSDPMSPELIARISFLNVSVLTRVAVDMEEPIKKSVELRIIKEGEVIPFWGDVQDKCIRIDLFDKYSKKENHFLATAQIPLRSVFLSGRIEGSLVMKAAPFYMSHEPMEQSPRLSLSVTMKPKLAVDSYPLPHPVGETDQINELAHDLWNKLRDLNNKRRYVFFVMTSTGKALLPCRLIKKQAIDGLEGNLALLAFVSLIPSVPDTDIPEKEGYVCHSSQAFLDKAIGSYLEHAILLCNVLLSRGEDAYVVLGSDISTGHCACVLTRVPAEGALEKKGHKKYTYLFIDPISGNIFQVSDPYCAVHDIGTVFNDKNIWFNLQATGRPNDISWDFEDPKTKNWAKFWTEKGGLPEMPDDFQPSQLKLHDYSEEHKQEIAMIVRKMVNESVENLRNPKKTVWNADLGSAIGNLVKNRKKLASSENHEKNEFDAMLNDVRKNYERFRIEGSPFFIGYVYDKNNLDDLEENINEEIKKRELYYGIEGAEMACSVVITPYPNDIFAIWILVVAANPKDQDKKEEDSDQEAVDRGAPKPKKAQSGSASDSEDVAAQPVRKGSKATSIRRKKLVAAVEAEAERQKIDFSSSSDSEGPKKETPKAKKARAQRKRRDSYRSDEPEKAPARKTPQHKKADRSPEPEKKETPKKRSSPQKEDHSSSLESEKKETPKKRSTPQKEGHSSSPDNVVLTESSDRDESPKHTKTSSSEVKHKDSSASEHEEPVQVEPTIKLGEVDQEESSSQPVETKPPPKPSPARRRPVGNSDSESGDVLPKKKKVQRRQVAPQSNRKAVSRRRTRRSPSPSESEGDDSDDSSDVVEPVKVEDRKRSMPSRRRGRDDDPKPSKSAKIQFSSDSLETDSD